MVETRPVPLLPCSLLSLNAAGPDARCPLSLYQCWVGRQSNGLGNTTHIPGSPSGEAVLPSPGQGARGAPSSGWWGVGGGLEVLRAPGFPSAHLNGLRPRGRLLAGPGEVSHPKAARYPHPHLWRSHR